MYKRICAICGNEFESLYIRSKYCKGCQAEAYRQKNTNRARERRAEMREAEQVYKRQQAQEKQREQEKESRERAVKYQKALEWKARNGDLIARLSLEGNKPGHLYSAEYWNSFREYALDFNGDRFETVVNAISTKEDDFVERVVLSMATCKRLVISTTERRKNVKQME